MKAVDIMRSTQIIAKYDPQTDFLISEDLIWCGDYKKISGLMTEEERHLMDEIGWFEDEEKNLWSRFV